MNSQRPINPIKEAASKHSTDMILACLMKIGGDIFIAHGFIDSLDQERERLKMPFRNMPDGCYPPDEVESVLAKEASILENVLVETEKELNECGNHVGFHDYDVCDDEGQATGFGIYFRTGIDLDPHSIGDRLIEIGQVMKEHANRLDK